MSASLPWMTASDGEPALHAQLRKAFNTLSQNGCSLSPSEFFPIAFGIYMVGANEGAGSQIEHAQACAERALGRKVDFTPIG
ncbi:hypothetical protein ACVWW6_006043 [Bradyrhizobium sp. USDA 3311]